MISDSSQSHSPAREETTGISKTALAHSQRKPDALADGVKILDGFAKISTNVMDKETELF